MLCPADDSLEAVVARIRLNGRSAVHFRGSYQRTGEFGEVLSERLALLRVPVFPESILDMTRSELDLDSVIQQGGFLADLLELSRRASEEPDVAAELVDSIAESVPKTTYGDLKAEIQSLREPVILEAFLQEAGELVAELFVEPSGS